MPVESTAAAEVTAFRWVPDLVQGFPDLAAIVARGGARPMFQRALPHQLAVFAENEPEPQPA